MNGFTIGVVAERAAVNIETLRYYERRGLIPTPPRTAANYRRYPPDTVKRVRFVKHAQDLGFSLKEVRELLSLRAAPKTRCTDVRQRAEAKIRAIDEKLRSLRAMRRALSGLVAECLGDGPVTTCPILESIDSEDVLV